MAWKAGLLAVLVHVLLVGVLLFSFQWKAAHSVVSVSEVELWNELPSKSQTIPVPKPPVVEPPPEVKEEPEPEPEEPEVEQPEPEPETPKVDIELENKKKAEEEKKRLKEEKKKKLALKKKKAAEKKRRDKLKKMQQALLDEDFDPNKKANEDALKQLQQMNSTDLGSENKKRAGAASQGVVDKYIAKIQAKVRGNVNKSLCEDGNPEPQFRISLLPNGEFKGKPSLVKSSGNAICDDAVERAIIASEPFPLPSDPDALIRFRDLNLKFKPNAG